MSSDKAVPVGEGWTRHSNEILVHAPSQVYFAERGDQRGKYLVKGDKGAWAVCPAPHSGAELPLELRAAAASVLRQADGAPGAAGADRKLERAVVIAEMPKTARLALKFPLGFLDTPAAAYALFSSLRGNSGAAHWCASQFHQRLLPEIGRRIHGWWDSEGEMPEELLYRGSYVGSLATLLRETLEGLDRDLLAGQHAFGGCEAVVAVLVGESLVVAAAGQATATLLFDDADAIPLLARPDGEPAPSVAQLRRGQASELGALLGRDGLLRRAVSVWNATAAVTDDASAASTADQVSRLLRAPDAFAVLGLPAGGPAGPSEVRSAYKRLALRVHPDKVRGCDAEDAKVAFARLESAARAVEALVEQCGEACRELHRVLRCDPVSLRGAAQLLQIDVDSLADIDDAQIKNALEKAKTALAKAQARDGEAELRRGLDACAAAAETLRTARQGGAPGSAGERLLQEGVPVGSLQALGLRDLRGLGGGLEVRTASWRAGEELRVALCCGATAELEAQSLQEAARCFLWQPKAAALQWATRALALPSRKADTSATAICVCIRDRLEEENDAAFDDRPAKKQKVAGPRSIRVRHLLLRCAEPGRPLPDDPMARQPPAGQRTRTRGGGAADAAPPAPRTPAEAEELQVARLRGLLEMKPSSAKGEGDLDAQRLKAFRLMCQQHSECSSADNAGQLCGDLGWVSRGQGEASFDQAAFSLRRGELSDVVTTSRGVHIIQRLA